MNAKVYCNGTRIKCLHEIELTVGMSGAPVEFDFSSEWDGLGKTAVFTCDGTRDVILDADGKAVVPHEILTTPGMDVEVGVYAVKDDGTTWPAPTPMCRIGRVKYGADPSGDESYPPTPDVGEQAVAAAGAALALAQEAKESADSSVKSVNGVKPDANGNVNVAGGGGSSGGASIELDTTLTQSGKAADAKAVGDALAVYVLSLSTDEADAQANSDAVTAAIAEHGHVVLKAGVYPFGSMVTIPDNTTLDLGQATIFQTTYKSDTPLFCLNGVNATLKNGFLRGTYDKNDDDEGYEFFEGEVLVRVDACENGLIENVDAGFAWGVSLAFGSLAQDRGYVGSAANTSGAEHTSAALPIVEGYSYVMAYGQIGYNYIFSIAPVEYVFYDADGVALKTVTEIPRIPVGIPSGAATFTIKTICPEFLAYYYGFTNVMPMLTVRDCYFHNNHSGGFCNSTHIITVENTKFAFMGTVDNTRTKSTRSTIYGIDIEDYPTPFMRLSNCSFIKCPKSVMDGSTISQVDNCYGYDCDFGVYRGWYHIYNNLTANEFYVQGHNNEWQYPRVYLNGGKFNTAPVLHGNSGEYLFMNASEATLVGVNPNYTGGEFAPFTTYVKPNYNSGTFSFRSVLRNVALIDYSLASAGDRRASLFPKKGSEHCVWKTPYLYEKTYAGFVVAPYDIYGLTTDLPIYPAGFTFYDCVFKCRFTGFEQRSGQPENAFVGTYENCVIDCDNGGGSLFPYSNMGGVPNGVRTVDLTFKNCVINNSSVPLLFGENKWVHSFAEGSKITFINCTVSNTEANGIIGNADLTNLTVAYTSGGEGGVDIDASLTVEGAAADAAATGEALKGKQPAGNYVKSVNGTAPDASGNVTVEAGGSGETAGEWEEFLRFTTDNAETAVFDFSSNGTETLESKKVKEVYIYSPSCASGAAEASGMVTVNGRVSISKLATFTRTTLGCLKLWLCAKVDALDLWYFGRDSDANLGGGTQGLPVTWSVVSESNGLLSATVDSKNAYRRIHAYENGIPMPSGPVDYIKTVTVSLSAPSAAGVEFIVYVR